MCGIAFIYHSDGRQASAAAIRRMVKAQQHRGPDALTQLERGPVALGHARLSIVDLKGGSQPMLSDDGRYALVFNGEIYNFQALREQLEKQGVQFRTASDTEVVLRLYERDGAACVGAFRGMFALAVHDRETGRLFLARDRLGIKPLFYHWDGTTLTGGSEIKALFASGLVEPRLDPVAIRSYFRYQFAVPAQTPFASVTELLPGHTLEFMPGGTPVTRAYWDLHFPREGEYESEDEAYWLQQFGDALDDAAASHTIGDVPIGAYLSGGVDSAATTCLLKAHYPQRLQSYTIRFTNPANDESSLAAEIAQHLDMPNQTMTMDDQCAEGFLQELQQCIYHLEQPQRMAVDIPHFLLSALVHKHQQKVVYTGDGADEILGGYDCYRQDAIRIWGNQRKNFRERRRYYLNEFTQDFAEQHVRMLLDLHRHKAQRATIRQFGCYPAWHDFWHILDDVSEPLFSGVLKETVQDPLLPVAEQMREHISGLHPLNQSLYIETKTRLPGWILWKSDRLSMAHSVEARVPFMDHPLVELAARVPPALKLNGMDEKYILRKLMLPRMPAHPTHFKKRAFYTPIREWFFTPERQADLEPFLSDVAIERCGLFRAQTVRAYLERINRYGQPQDMNQYYEVMKLEWVLLLVLSVQMLHQLFVERQAACFKLDE
jgi:asparagine synthase (glutamine-hydrolysing)